MVGDLRVCGGIRSCRGGPIAEPDAEQVRMQGQGQLGKLERGTLLNRMVDPPVRRVVKAKRRGDLRGCHEAVVIVPQAVSQRLGNPGQKGLEDGLSGVDRYWEQVGGRRTRPTRLPGSR